MYKTTFHRDGTVTYWNVYTQGWERVNAKHISDKVLASVGIKDRERILKIREKS
jgi:hypothetical protein